MREIIGGILVLILCRSSIFALESYSLCFSSSTAIILLAVLLGMIL